MVRKVLKTYKYHYYYRCQTALKQGAKACPIGQISRIDIEAIGVSMIRMLCIDESLLKSVMDSAGDNQQAKIETLIKEKTEIRSRISDLEEKINKWMTHFESSEDSALVEVITDRVSGYKQSIVEMQSAIEEIDQKIVTLGHPVENLDNLMSSYQYFWNRWPDLKFTDRQRIVKTIIKELRLFSESPKHYRLEVDLFGDVNVDILTSQDGGGGQVRTSLRKSTVDPNKVPTVIWRTSVIKITRRKHFPIGLELTRESLPTKRLHQRFQKILREELPFALNRGKKPQTKQFADVG